jgi:hypothetical protein
MRALRAIQLTLKIYHWAMMFEGVRDRMRETKRGISKRAAQHAKARAKQRRARRHKARPFFSKKPASVELFGRSTAAA